MAILPKHIPSTSTEEIIKSIENLRASRNFDGAISLLDAALRTKRHTDNPTLWCIGGELCSDRAMKLGYFKMSLDIDPKHLRTINNLISFYSDIGNKEKVAEYTALARQIKTKTSVPKEQQPGVTLGDLLNWKRREEPL